MLHPVTPRELSENDPRTEQSQKWTLCEILREIFRKSESEGNQEVMLLAHKALCYATRMDRALRDRKKIRFFDIRRKTFYEEALPENVEEYDAGWWETKG